MLPVLLALLGVLGCAAGHAASPTEAPPTRADATLLNHWGVELQDPYQWLERSQAAEVKAWFKVQDEHTRQTLSLIPGRAALRARLGELHDSLPQVHSMQAVGEWLFFLRRDAGATQYRLYQRHHKGEEHLLVDPAQFDQGGQPGAIDYYYVSPNGKRLAFGISLGGTEDSTLHVRDLESGAALGEPIPRAEDARPIWRMDSAALYYTQLAEPQAGDPPAARYRNAKARMREFRADAPGRFRDIALLGRGLNRNIALEDDDLPSIRVSPISPWAVGEIRQGVRNELVLYVAPVPTLRGAHAPWRKVIEVEHGVTAYDLRGDYLYLLTHNDAPRFRILRLPLSKAGSLTLADAEEVLPHGERVITAMDIAKDSLYVRQIEAGYSRLLRLQFNVKPPKSTRRAPVARATKVVKGGKGKKLVRRVAPPVVQKVAGVALRQDLALPLRGSVLDLATDPLHRGAWVRLAGWTEAPRIFEVDGKTGKLAATDILPAGNQAMREVEVKQVRVPSHDGALIPVSILSARGQVLDGNAPTLIVAYGAYGIILQPRYNPLLYGWIEKGGIVAVAHVRGGGEFGTDWHMGGYQKTKPNSWKDVIAAAEYLIAERFTRPERLAAQGGSAGGIVIGGLLVERPELFAALVSLVGVHDSVAAEISANGPPNIPEFGSVTTEEGFHGLLAMSSYHRVAPGKSYPAMLLTTGINDPRVDSWQPGKMAARLQAINHGPGGSRQPVLLRVDYAGGHGLTSTREQVLDEVADRYAFLFWRMGVPGFAPAP
ncbi:prolyl oligopeptidase [Burkholderiales bacterium]|nr:prolyl oligopeptidase [Burkholderiales bacterium]